MISNIFTTEVNETIEKAIQFEVVKFNYFHFNNDMLNDHIRNAVKNISKKFKNTFKKNFQNVFNLIFQEFS